MTKKIISLCMALVMALCILNACSAQSAEQAVEISILKDGEEISSMEFLYGETNTFSLDALVEGEISDETITWSSDDAGVVRVKEAEGTGCNFAVLKTGSVKITAQCGDASASVKVKVEKNQDALAERDVALTVDGDELSAEKVQMIMAVMYNQFVGTYGDYASYYGLDISGGLEGLADQECDYSSDGTWKGYFLDEAISNIKEMYALAGYAEQQGISLEDAENEEIQNTLAAFEDDAREEGYDDYDKYAAYCFGDGETESIYEWYLNLSELASKAYAEYYEALEYSDEEIKEHYTEMGYEDDGSNDYAMASMRHILIMAEADENGEYTDDAINEAHEKAEEIYREWLDGDMSEESFAELANEYSEDSGSNTTGGLYEDIYKDQMITEINDYLFADRTPGDSAIVDHNGNYVGTHIVYFVGNGEIYSTYLAESDLKDTDTEEWLSSLVEAVDLEYGAAYDKI